VNSQTSFTPTLRFMKRIYPKWEWHEYQDMAASPLRRAFEERGHRFDGAIVVGQRELSKRCKAKSYIAVDKWTRRCCYINTMREPLAGVDSFEWEPNDRKQFTDLMRTFLSHHEANRQQMLTRITERAKRVRRDGLLVLHERRHGDLSPLDKLRMRYRE